MPYKDRERGLRQKREDYRRKREQILAAKREYYQLHKSRIKPAIKRAQYRRRYGLTEEALRALVDAQIECPICVQPFQTDGRHRSHIDHDHATGKVRGLLCFQCNVGLGNFGEDTLRLQRAIEYLVKHRK